MAHVPIAFGLKRNDSGSRDLAIKPLPARFDNSDLAFGRAWSTATRSKRPSSTNFAAPDESARTSPE